MADQDNNNHNLFAQESITDAFPQANGIIIAISTYIRKGGCDPVGILRAAGKFPAS